MEFTKIALYGVDDTACKCVKGPLCPSPGKHPKAANWSTNIVAPVAGDNIGIVTGDDLWVLDVDVKNGGMKSLQELLEKHGKIPKTYAVRTGSGGAHFYFKGVKGLKNSAGKLAPGIDVRAKGGMVVAAGSIHASGNTYVAKPAEVVDAPQWLLDLIPKTTEHKTPDKTQLDDARRSIHPSTRLTRAAGYVSQVDGAVEGEGGDDKTFQVASVGHSFGVEEKIWYTWMLDNYNPRCKPPWSKTDLKKKVENGYAYGDRPFAWRLTDLSNVNEALNGLSSKELGEDGQVNHFYVLESERDVDLAKAWYAQSELKLLNASGGIYEFHNGCWRPFELEILPPLIMHEINGARADVNGKFVRLALGHAQVNGIGTLITKLVTKVSLNTFEAGLNIGVATNDAIWHVNKAGEISRHEHSIKNVVCQTLDVDLSEVSSIDRWLKFLNEVFQGDQECIQFLQEFMGCSMVGNITAFAKSMWLVGSGRNGKSTLLEIIENTCFSDDRVSHSPPQSWKETHSKFEMRRALLNVVSEIEERALFNSAEIKAIIAGDKTSARDMYKSFVSFIPRAGHIFAANDLPDVADRSKGFWARMVPIPMSRQFAENAKKRHSIKDDIMEHERSGVVRWSLEGAANAMQRGTFILPTASASEKGKWRESSDPVRQFRRACLTTGGHATYSDLYENYCTWYLVEHNGRANGLSKTRLNRRFEAMGLERKKHKNKEGFICTIKPRLEWTDFHTGS